MRLALELGRILLADGLRAGARAADLIADRLWPPEPSIGLEDVGEGDGPLVTHEALELVAERAPAPPAEARASAPLAGSLAARGAEVGRPWRQ